ncbi:MAG: SpoIIE family protein phosphatase [Bacteroidetes bacterium]|nr:SpoIIE family protein phosphatase [Bacteroidota bacterium]MBU1720434.1 SpoIIE family protein phosphatase [Bacteroidota bacterium]
MKTKKHRKLATKLSLGLMVMMGVIMTGFTFYIVHDRTKDLEKRILTKGIVSAQTGAEFAGHLLELIIDNGIYTRNEIFDTRLVPIDLPDALVEKYNQTANGRDLAPLKKYHYETMLDVYLDNNILPLQEIFMLDKEVIFAVLTDQNGYIPTHNIKYSRPLTGDYEFDLANNRSKRLFNDSVGSAAAKNETNKFLKQVYKRDTGELIWDISAPVFVKGEHWGAFRIGFSIERTYAEMAGLRNRLIVIMIVLMALVVIIINRVTAYMLRPLKLLNTRVEQLSSDDQYRKTGIRTNDEIGALGYAFDKMVDNLKEYINTLRDTTAAKERIQSELKIATDIQLSMLPRIFPAFPDRPEFDIYATMRPAKEVGGDFYDFYMVNDNKLCFVVGDVSGKGVPAALFMVICKTLIKTEAQRGCAIEEVFYKVNNMLCPDNNTSMFVTVFAGILDVRTGVLQMCCAGHNPPILAKDGEDPVYLKYTPQMAMGVFENIRYNPFEIVMKPHDRLVVYTDGVTEANNPHQTLYTTERLLEKFIKFREQNNKELIDNIVGDVDYFASGAMQADDITLLGIKMNQPKGMIAEKKTVEIKNEVSELDRLSDELTDFSMRNGIPDKILFKLNLCLEEIVSNVIFYAFENPGQHFISVHFLTDGSIFQIQVCDEGIEFNPLKRETPQSIGKSLEEKEIGGLGVHLVRNFMDDLKYERTNDKNVLTMTKNL